MMLNVMKTRGAYAIIQQILRLGLPRKLQTHTPAQYCSACVSLWIVMAFSSAVYAEEFYPSPVAAQAQAFPAWRDAQATAMDMPEYQRSVRDPDTKQSVWRLGGSGQEMGAALTYPDGNGAIGILHAQHFYSKTSPSNADESHVLSSGGQNQRYSALWRLADKRLVAWVPGPKRQAHLQQRQLLWDKQQANAYWYTEANRLIKAEINFATYQVTTTVWEVFDSYQYITIGFGEGDFSDDGEKVVLAGQSAQDGYVYFTPYEVKQRRKHPARQVTFADQTEFDWVGVDPSGQYILFDRRKPQKQTVAVAFEQAAHAEPHLLYPHTKHSDFVIDHAGEVWIVYGNWQGLFASRLSDGKDKKVWPVDNQSPQPERDPTRITASGHVARVAAIPGLVLVSRNYDGGLYFINIDRPAHSVYLGNTRHGRLPEPVSPEKTRAWGVNEHGEVTFYKREPRGAVSASGLYLFFVSDYQSYLNAPGGYDPEPEQAKAYLNMIDLGQ